MTHTKDEALRMALEALKIARDQIVDPEYAPIGWSVSRLDEVLANGQQALAAPVHELTIEDNSQDWAGMDGATALHLINRHAGGWADVAKMMGEWLAANTPPAAPVQEPVECQYGNGGYACCEGGPCKADQQNNAAAQPAPVQEPVGKWIGDCIEWTENPYKLKKGQPLYTTPPAQPAPVQEPVAWMQSDEVHISLWKDDYHTIPLYTTPPAAPVQEPVIFYRCNGCGHAYEQMPPTSCDCMETGGFDRVEYYTNPPAAQPVLKDHETAQIVNRITAIAKQYGQTDQLRERIAQVLFPAAQQAPVPDGWKLVPVEPTREMWTAVNKLDDQCAAGNYDGKGCSIEQAWNCLLDAAPTPPAQPAPVPLTDEQIIDIRRKTTAKTHGEWADTKTFARAIEAAHKIGVKK